VDSKQIGDMALVLVIAATFPEALQIASDAVLHMRPLRPDITLALIAIIIGGATIWLLVSFRKFK
jgi:hypothetical protein